MSKATVDKSSKPIVKAIAKLGYQLCLDQNHERNLVFSPFGIYSMLGLLFAGARGETRQRLAHVFGGKDNDSVLVELAGLSQELKGRSQLTEAEANVVRQHLAKREELLAQGMDPQEVESDLPGLSRMINLASMHDFGFNLAMGNSLWVQEGYPIQPAYLAQIQQTLEAQVKMLDIQGKREEACALINAWVSENTRGLINSALTPIMLPPLVRAILVNAVYFKGLWRDKFSSPHPGSFHLFDGTPVQAQMMAQMDNWRYVENKDFQAVILPYKYRPVSMVILLPQASGKKAFIEAERKLEEQGHDQLLSMAEAQRFRLFIPEFEMAWRGDLVQLLSRLGLDDVFGTGDFSGVSEEAGLGIDSILHQARIRVDRYGTEAVAVTTMTVFGMMAIPKIVELKIDRPFLFLIIDEPTGAVLFTGRVVDPR